jgi:hypothetical protein
MHPAHAFLLGLLVGGVAIGALEVIRYFYLRSR